MDVRLREIADFLLAHTKAAEVRPASVGKLLRHLFVLDIERDLGKAFRLRIRLIGTAVDEIFRRPLKGHALEDYIHGPRGDDVLAGFHHCADTREPLWMRQVVRVKDHLPRFVEGIAVYLEPERIYGGLVTGEVAGSSVVEGFERQGLVHTERRALTRSAAPTQRAS